MAKLGNIKPRIGSIAPRLGAVPQTERARDQQRSSTQSWRSWYKLARWTKLRQRVLVRDRYTCRKTGILLIGKHPAPNSPVVDHIKPHRGDERLFWDESNLQTVSKEYHDRTKQAEEAKDIKGVWY